MSSNKFHISFVVPSRHINRCRQNTQLILEIIYYSKFIQHRLDEFLSKHIMYEQYGPLYNGDGICVDYKLYHSSTTFMSFVEEFGSLELIERVTQDKINLDNQNIQTKNQLQYSKLL
jgi:hypothetical protein